MDEEVVAHKELLKKAKRRINRLIKTDTKQARVSSTDDVNVFEYKSKHHVSTLRFRKDRIGRLRQLS